MASAFGSRSCSSGRKILEPFSHPPGPIDSGHTWIHLICNRSLLSTTPLARKCSSLSILQRLIIQRQQSCPRSLPPIPPSARSSNPSRSRAFRRQFHSSCIRKSAPLLQPMQASDHKHETFRSLKFSLEFSIRRRSNRISRLPTWKNAATLSPASLDLPNNRHFTKPTHASLLEFHNHLTSGVDCVALDVVLDALNQNWKEFSPHDFSFTLEMIQGLSLSQQEFWESMSTLIRYSVSHMRHVYKHDALAWEKTLAFAMIEVYWRQRQTVFIEQIEKAKSRPSPTHVVDFLGPFTSDAEVLAHTMINSLCLTNYHNRALRLYEALSDHGIRMPSRFIDNFIRFAVSLGDGYQLEAIGNMMLRQEKLYRQSMLSDSPEMQLKNRLSIIAARSMDSFVYGACENGLNELARAVFNQGLEVNQKYRLSTFDGILNSYSISEFGFDIVEAANAGLKKVKKSWRPKDTDRPTVYDTSFVTRSIPKAITVADPKDIEKYISAMETLGIKPNIVTLNIIVKLYLEMAQHKVKDAPSWESAFTRYNPLGLKPDLVTNNTLLAFYEKQKDLTTMKLIYDDMAGTPDRRLPDNSKRARKLQRKLEAEQDRFFDRDTLNSDKTNEFVYSDDNAPLEREESREIQSRNDRYSPARYVRSNRDIFTYNTMIHALLQHAVDSKDIDSIGQCFHDMELDGIKPDTVTFNTNILYHISRGDYTAAMQVFRSMDSKRIRTKKMTTDASDPWAFGNMSSTSTLANSISGASKPIRSTPSMESSLLRSVRTRELGAQIQNDLYQESINTKGPAATSPPVPDIISFTSLISGFGQSDNLDKATEMFMEMTKRFKIEPNLKTYSALAAGLNRAGDHERAERLWNEVIGADQNNSMKTRSGFSHDSGYRRQLIQIYKSMLQNEELMLGDDEKAERLRYKLLIMGETSGVLTFKERRQFEARRKMYRDSMKE